MSFGLGFWAAAGGEAYTGAFEQIATTVLTSASSSASFTSIPQIYKHLQVRAVLNPSSGGSGFGIGFNAVSGGYSMHRLSANGSSVFSGAATSSSNIQLLGFHNGSTTSVPIPVIVDILDYANTSKNKTSRALLGSATSNAELVLSSGGFYSTNAITSIEISSGFNSAIGSRFSLYGIRG
jgi:hypothetical protein